MAIIYPVHLKGMTTGAMRQIKQHGSTTAAGGWHSMDTLYELAADTNIYLSTREPLGKYMTALAQAKEDAKEMTEALLKNTNAMVEQARESHKQMSDINGKLRDGAEKLGLAIEKFNKVAGNTNFAETAKQAESLVTSLERLAALEASGMLVTKIAYALGVTRQTVYNWFTGSEVFVAYRHRVELLLKIMQTSNTADEAWRRICHEYNLKP